MTEGHSRQPQRELELFARKVVIVVAIALLVVFLWYVRDVLLIIAIAAMLAAGISPVIKRVRVWVRHRTGRRIRRGTAVLLVYFPLLILAILVAIFGVPALLAESNQLVRQLPALIEEKILRPLNRYVPTANLTGMFEAARESFMKEAPLFVYVKSAVHVVTSFIAVLFLVAYMLIDADRLRNVVLLLYPAEERAQKRVVMRRMGRRLSSWIGGQLLLCAIIAGATFVGLSILRVPYAFPLAVAAGIGEFVPIIGPILGAIPALTVAIFQSTWQFWSVLVMAWLIQHVENYYLVPRVMGAKVSVSPLAVFIAFMMGGTLLGILGGMLAVPIAALMAVGFEEAFVRRRERRQDSERPGTLMNPDA